MLISRALLSFMFGTLLISCVQEMGTSGRIIPLASPGGSGLAQAPPHAVAQESAPAAPFRVTSASMREGHEVYNVHCAPCHGLSGYGDGLVVQHGFPAPPSFHSPAARAVPDSEWLKVITDGRGAMAPYASQISRADRQAVVIYIRALQLSQNAELKTLPAFDRARLADLEAK